MKKNKSLSNFKNYLAYIKKRTIQNNETLGKCNICNQNKKLKNNVCYGCYKQQYNKNIDYTKNFNSTVTTTTIATNTNKKKFALIFFGVIIPVVGISTYFIINFTKDNNIPLTLAQLKEKEKEKIRNIKPSEKILQGASLSPITTKNKYENIIDSAIKEINNSKTKDDLNAIVVKNTNLVTNARDIYANAIKFANKKHLANTEINKINYPPFDGAKHSAAKHALINNAKKTAHKAILEVTDINNIDEVKTAQIIKIQKAIDEYKASTETVKTLSDNKWKAIYEIHAINIPAPNSKAHSLMVYHLLIIVMEDAYIAIAGVTDINKIDEVKTAQIIKIQNALKAYNESKPDPIKP